MTTPLEFVRDFIDAAYQDGSPVYETEVYTPPATLEEHGSKIGRFLESVKEKFPTSTLGM